MSWQPVEVAGGNQVEYLVKGWKDGAGDPVIVYQLVTHTHTHAHTQLSLSFSLSHNIYMHSLFHTHTHTHSAGVN